MILLVIRHGESEADILDVHEGRADFELTQKGHRQAAAMAKYVAGNFQLIRIYSSTLKRAAQTAKHLSDETGTAVEYEPDLMEFNNGLLAGLSREEADRLYPPVENLPVDQAVYGQESKVAFRGRAVKVLQRVLSERFRVRHSNRDPRGHGEPAIRCAASHAGGRELFLPHVRHRDPHLGDHGARQLCG